MLASFINQITSRTGLDLVYISNFGSPDQSSVIEEIQYPLSIFQIDSILQKQRDLGKENCPVFGGSVSPNITYATIIIPENKVYVRKDILTFEKRHRIIFIWALKFLVPKCGFQRSPSLKTLFFSPPLTTFTGLKLQIGAIPYSPFISGVVLDEDDQARGDYVSYKDYSGFEIDMLNAASHIHNFTYQIQNDPNGFWGSVGPDGKWSGVTAMAQRGQVDMIISTIIQTYSRHLILDMTAAFWYDYLVPASPIPSVIPQYLAIIYPFSMYLWILVLLSVRERKLSKKISTSSAVTWLCGSWFIFCLIITAGYSSKLKSFLTNPIYSKPINTIEDVLESGLPWGMVKYDELVRKPNKKMMEKSNDSSIKKIWKNMEFLPFNALPDVESVFQSKRIVFDYRMGLQASVQSGYSTQDGISFVHVSDEPIFMKSPIAWNFNANNPWKFIFDNHINKCIRAGLVEFWARKSLYQLKIDYLKKECILHFAHFLCYIYIGIILGTLIKSNDLS
ncbi:unnamed protein product [Lepeophtheirus salmonis]|uniref:(salmon louse) hypothetical protein n=1 Tax=Lepeophtheirus salmonis TaxID=72036 RepID=A0A7R8D5Y6_LEPSM|nr:unnamed protein product [Lepeophtheirus salmonis]CAF3036106.1 unnamed protein product [Lepeophtheirus salmonis]